MKNTFDIQIRDVFLLKQLDSLMDQLKQKAAIQMEHEIKERFGLRGPKQIKSTKAKPFASIYTTTLTLSFLYGMLHAQKLTGEVNLSDNAFEVDFSEAEEFLRSQVAMPRKEYDELVADLKFRAFTIARVTQEDVINELKKRYIDHVKAGRSRHELLQQMDTLLDQAGLSSRNPAWLELHYRTNVMTAYNAGRWTQLQKSHTTKYLMYNAIVDSHTTELCKKLHGRVLPKDHPFWKKFYPPNHFQCRSLVTPVSETQIKARRLKIEDLTPKKFYEEDPELTDQLKSEHQFKAHPAAEWNVIPASMAQRADNYKTWPEIFAFYKKSLSSSFIKNKIKWLTNLKPSKYFWKHIKKRNLAKDIVLDAVSNPDEIYIGGHKLMDNMYLSYINIKWLDTDSGIAVKIRDKIRTAHIISKKELKRLLRQYGWQRIKP